MATYTYYPDNIAEYGKDRMRFELGDTMVEGGGNTSALTNEEYDAVLAMYPKNWKKAKLAVLESICRRFAFEVDTTTGPVSFSLSQRAKLWREDYESLKTDVRRGSMLPPANAAGGKEKGPYFYTGMMQNYGGRGR